jgi:tetratricopeptide (TPR) repeat protein
VYRLELAANPPKDFDSHFTMAKRAADLGLRQQAGTQARAAVACCKGAPDAEAKTKQVRAWAADALEKMVRDAVAEGDLPRAKKCLELLTTRLSDQRTDEQLDTVAAVVEELEGKHKQEQTNKRQARLDQKQRESIERHLKPIAQDVEKGTKAYQQAMRKNNTGASARLCEQSIEHFKKAYRALNALMEKNPDEPTLAAAATTLGKEMHDTAIAAALHAASMLCIQSDYKNAMEWAQKVLAFDPGNADAKAMVNTITTAAAEAGDEWRWGWTLGDIGKVGEGPAPKKR